MKLAIVLGTYNRRAHLERALASARRCAGDVEHAFVVVDGGSQDGSREYLVAQPDVCLITQRGPLTGAVRAFNLGFQFAIEELDAEYLGHFNDDAECVTPGMWAKAVEMIEADPRAGGVAFEFDTWGEYRWDHCAGDKPYVNYGVLRTEAARTVARAQGDPTGTKVWNPIYKTYAADTEAGAWLWKIGWTVLKAPGLKVHDLNVQDAMRNANHGDALSAGNRPDSDLFRQRWPRAREQTEPMGGFRWPKSGKLHIGCGAKRLVGGGEWVNADGLPTPAADVLLDLYQTRGVPSGVATQIYWSHGPEHIYPDKLDIVLRELRRILRPGGVLTLAAPDIEGIWQNRFVTETNGGAWNAAIFGECDSHHHPFLGHRQIFTVETLHAALMKAGFREARQWRPEQYPEIKALNDYATSCALVTAHVEGVA